MGYLGALDFAENADIEVALRWHMRSNHFPPLPEAFVPAAKEAIDNALRNDWDAPIDLRGECTYRGERTAPTQACVEAWHLQAFLDAARPSNEAWGYEEQQGDSTPSWIKYGGPAWSPDVLAMVTLPERVYPVVDLIIDERGDDGLLVRHGGLDFALNNVDIFTEEDA